MIKGSSKVGVQSALTEGEVVVDGKHHLLEQSELALADSVWNVQVFMLMNISDVHVVVADVDDWASGMCRRHGDWYVLA